jgi:HD-GYP domain-containing protein (c-di-GMP phosphodiesterase class II)
VTEIAGGHHETMDGKGYPRGLTKDQMPASARMMAIADIFEALTASDRPYKTAKPVSQSLDIMSGMARRHHIDEELFKLFLREKVYVSYGQRYLQPAQLDTVNYVYVP